MREKKQYPYSEIRNFTAGRRTKSFQKENNNNGTSSSSSDDEFKPKYKKSYGENINANFNAFMYSRREELIEADDVLFKNRKIFPQFVLAPLRGFLNPRLEKLSLQQLECELDSTGYPEDHNFFELGYCGHTQFPHSNIFLDQASALILSQFQEEDHPFIRKALQDEGINLVSLYYVYRPNTNTPIRKIRKMMKTLINLVKNMEVNTLV